MLLLLLFKVDNLSWDGTYEESEDIILEFDTENWLLVLLFSHDSSVLLLESIIILGEVVWRLLLLFNSIISSETFSI